MAWEIAWTHQAWRDLERLDPPVARRVVRKLEQAAAAADPPRRVARLRGHDDRKRRIGDYRLLALLSADTATILVLRVAHRSRVYREK